MHEVNSENYKSTNQNLNKNITGVNPIPEEYAGATPYLYVNMASAALEFYKQAFNAEVLVEINNEQKRGIFFSQALVSRV